MNCFKLYRQKPFQEGALQALRTSDRWLILSVNMYLTKMHEFTCPKRKGKWHYKNSLFEIPYTDPSPCRSILVCWTNTTFVCSLSFRFVKPKQESMGCRNEISSQISSSQITETRSCMNKLAFPPSILPPAVLRHMTVSAGTVNWKLWLLRSMECTNCTLKKIFVEVYV